VAEKPDSGSMLNKMMWWKESGQQQAGPVSADASEPAATQTAAVPLPPRRQESAGQ